MRCPRSPAILLIALAPPFLGACEPEELPPADPEDVFALAGEDVVVEVGTEIVLDGRESSLGDALWDLGDGTVVEGYLARHTYTEPGNYVAVLAVTGEGGRTRTDSVRVTAHLPLAEPAPVQSSALVVDEARGRALVAVPEADHLAVIDLATQALSTVPTCAGPRQVFLHDAEIGVSCEDDGQVLFLDAESLTELRTRNLGAGTRPFGLVARDDTWWVAEAARGELFEIEGNFQTRHVVGRDPRAVALDADGTVYATRFRAPGFRGEVYTLDRVLPLALDPSPDTDTGNRGVPNLLGAMAISPDGGTAFVGGTTANVERGLWRDGTPLTFESTLRATVRILDLETGEEDLDARKVFDNEGHVSALALSPLGNWLYVAHPGTGTVERLDAYTLDSKTPILGAGSAVDALALADGGDTLLVHAWLDRELRAYDVSDPSAVPTLAWSAPTVDTEPLSDAVLTGKRLFHSAGPRMARDGYISCATCHPDGTHDGQVWDFTDRGEGLRNTITIEGVAGSGMLHWTGNFDELQDFEIDIRVHQGGEGLLPDADWEVASIANPNGDPKAGLSSDLDALAAYMASLPEPPVSPHQHSGNGAALFVQKQCSTCHVPDLGYTDSVQPTQPRHDVGTWTEASGTRLDLPFDGEFDTPTLLGVWATAPYLHDGSAPNLESAIGAHDLPGVTLTPNDKIVLAAYIRTL